MMIGLRRVVAAALVTLSAPAAAAEISLVSLYFSKAHPVPHFHYEGDTDIGDVAILEELYDTFVHCRTECLGESGGSTAVVTLSGPGGNYHEGLALADFFRANHIATLVRNGDGCASACAFAFLGGSGYSSSSRIGTYVDRMVEPGSVIGFHAPFIGDDQLGEVLAERSPRFALDVTRDGLSLMVQELMRWNVDPEIVHQLLGMGPDQLYTLTTTDSLYLLRAALPPTPSGAWIADLPDAVRNVCGRLLAYFERTHPYLGAYAMEGLPFEPGIASNAAFGSLSGYRLSHDPLALGHCSVTDASAAAGSDLEISLYMNPGIEGSSEPLLSFFNRQDWFSTAGIGGSATRRVLQRGGLNHWFLPIGAPLDSVAAAGRFAVTISGFFTIRVPSLPPPLPELWFETEDGANRMSRVGEAWVFEQVGDADLYHVALAARAGRNLTLDSVGAESFVREGTFADGTAFELVGFINEGAAYLMHTLYPPASEPDPATRAQIARLECAAEFAGIQLACN